MMVVLRRTSALLGKLTKMLIRLNVNVVLMGIFWIMLVVKEVVLIQLNSVLNVKHRNGARIV